MESTASILIMPTHRPFKDVIASIGKPRKVVTDEDLPDGILRWEKVKAAVGIKFRITLKVDGVKKQILITELRAQELMYYLQRELL